MPITFEIVCPDQKFLSASADMVVVPASEGDIGVMEGHTPLIVSLRGGVVAVYENERVTDQWFVVGGFAEVTPDRCIVLANEVIPLAELRPEEADRRLRAAEASYAALSPDDIEARMLALDDAIAARAMLDVAAAGLGRHAG